MSSSPYPCIFLVARTHVFSQSGEQGLLCSGCMGIYKHCSFEANSAVGVNGVHAHLITSRMIQYTHVMVSAAR